MRAASAKLRCRCAGCLVVSAIAIGSACRRLDHGDAATTSAIADRDAGVADAAPPVPASPCVRAECAPRGPAARGVPVTNPPCVAADCEPSVLTARGVPAERGPRLPRQRLIPSRPADDRRGLPAIRRHRGAFLVRAVDPAGAAAAVPLDPRDLPHRPSGSPHRELLRRVIGL